MPPRTCPWHHACRRRPPRRRCTATQRRAQHCSGETAPPGQAVEEAPPRSRTPRSCYASSSPWRSAGAQCEHHVDAAPRRSWRWSRRGHSFHRRCWRRDPPQTRARQPRGVRPWPPRTARHDDGHHRHHRHRHRHRHGRGCGRGLGRAGDPYSCGDRRDPHPPRRQASAAASHQPLVSRRRRAPPFRGAPPQRVTSTCWPR